MKKLLPFAGFAAAILGIVSLILMLSTASINGTISLVGHVSSDVVASGIEGLFGSKNDSGTEVLKAVPGGIIGFVLLILGIVCVLCASLLPIFLKKGGKIGGYFGIVGCLLLIVAGILIFCEKSMFCSANDISDTIIDQNNYTKFSLGGGWVTAGILSIVGGIVAILPSTFAFISKKK